MRDLTNVPPGAGYKGMLDCGMGIMKESGVGMIALLDPSILIDSSSSLNGLKKFTKKNVEISGKCNKIL